MLAIKLSLLRSLLQIAKKENKSITYICFLSQVKIIFCPDNLPSPLVLYFTPNRFFKLLLLLLLLVIFGRHHLGCMSGTSPASLKAGHHSLSHPGHLL